MTYKIMLSFLMAWAPNISDIHTILPGVSPWILLVYDVLFMRPHAQAWASSASGFIHLSVRNQYRNVETTNFKLDNLL